MASKDEKSVDSEPLLEPRDEESQLSSLESDVLDQPSLLIKSNGSQRSLSRWLSHGVMLPYIPLLILCIVLYFKISSRPQCLTSQLDVFPCEHLPRRLCSFTINEYHEALSHSGALEYSRHRFAVRLHNNRFSGPPRPELDAAWHDLFESISYNNYLPYSETYLLITTSFPNAQIFAFASPSQISNTTI